MITRLELAAARMGDLAAARLARLPDRPGYETVGRGRRGAVGIVESVYRNAVNLAIGLIDYGVAGDGFGRGGGRCDAWSLCLIPAGVPLHPYAVTVSGVEDAAGNAPDGARVGGCGTWGEHPDTVGQVVFLGACRGEQVLLGKHAIGFADGRLSIALDAAEVFDSRLDPLPPAEALDAVRAGEIRDAVRRGVRPDHVTSWFLIAAMESRVAPAEGDSVPAGLMADATRRRLVRLREVLGCMEASLEQIKGLVTGLVGFGEGLTPSGDDFLLGLLAASRFVRRPASERLEAALVELTPTFAVATTRESSRMLVAAVAGNYPEPIIGLLAAAGKSDADGVRHWADCLGSLGAASGQDMLAGVIFWLDGKVRES